MSLPQGARHRVKITYYSMPQEVQFRRTNLVSLRNRSGRVIAVVPRAFRASIALDGTGILRDGRTVQIYGSRGARYFDTVESTGLTANGCYLVPYRTIAVDRRIVPLGSLVFIPSAVGMVLPNGAIHDGYFYANDVGGVIKGAHIDLYTGTWGPASFVSCGIISGKNSGMIVLGRLRRPCPFDWPDAQPPTEEAVPAAYR